MTYFNGIKTCCSWLGSKAVQACSKTYACAASSARIVQTGIQALDAATIKIGPSTRYLKEAFIAKRPADLAIGTIQLAKGLLTLLSVLELFPNFGQAEPLNKAAFGCIESSVLSAIALEAFTAIQLLFKGSGLPPESLQDMSLAQNFNYTVREQLSKLSRTTPHSNIVERVAQLFKQQGIASILFASAEGGFGTAVILQRKGKHLLIVPATLSALQLLRSIYMRLSFNKLAETHARVSPPVDIEMGQISSHNLLESPAIPSSSNLLEMPQLDDHSESDESITYAVVTSPPDLSPPNAPPSASPPPIAAPPVEHPT